MKYIYFFKVIALEFNSRINVFDLKKNPLLPPKHIGWVATVVISQKKGRLSKATHEPMKVKIRSCWLRSVRQNP